MIGGSSAINGMIYMLRPGHRLRPMAPARPAGLVMGRRTAVLPQACGSFSREQRAHAAGGEWRVEVPRISWEILDAFRDAAAQYGIPAVNDFNTGDNEGSCYFHVNQKRGWRWSAARGFLKPVLNRQNLRLETGCLVEGSDLRGQARRAACASARTALSAVARCRGEVVMAAGSLGSPQIMMLSGVGPAGAA